MKKSKFLSKFLSFFALGFSLIACGGGGEDPVNVTLTHSSYVIEAGKTFGLTDSFSPEQEADNYVCIWGSSNAMNGTSTSTRIINITPQWVTLLNTGITIINVGFYVSIAALVAFSGLIIFFEFKGKKKEEATDNKLSDNNYVGPYYEI